MATSSSEFSCSHSYFGPLLQTKERVLGAECQVAVWIWVLSPLSYSGETESYRVKLICWQLRARIQTQVSSALVYLGFTLKCFYLKTVISLYSISSPKLVERNPSQEVARSTSWNNGALYFPPALLAKEATWVSTCATRPLLLLTFLHKWIHRITGRFRKLAGRQIKVLCSASACWWLRQV